MSSQQSFHNKKLLVLLIDGFRWDYFERPNLELPGFARLFKQGVKADYMIPDFPSLSFPNYYSIMAGRYVEDHGVVGNFMYDKEKQCSFELNMRTDESNNSHWFEDVEPLWISAVKQEKRTYMFDWPSGHICNRGISSTFYHTMDSRNWPDIPKMEENLNKAFQLFKADKIDMAGVYLNSVDEWGHSYGPNSLKMDDIIRQTDCAIARMLDKLSTESMEDKVNIIIFSDHGMTEVSESRTIDISDHIGSTDVEAVCDKGPICCIWPKEGKLDKVCNGLKEMKQEHMSVYKKEDLPERWHYKNHKRVAPIVVVADIGWYILTPNGQHINHYLDGPAKGYHGYDNAEADMRGIFLAAGPAFKTNFKTGPIRAVDIYQVMCKALGIEPLPHNGAWSTVQDIFI